MKTSIQIFITVVLISMLTYEATGQYYGNATVVESLSLQNVDLFDTGLVGSSKPASTKIARSFAALFPTATGQHWVENASVFFVSFIHEGNKASAVFTRSGHLNYSITCLKPSDISGLMMKKINERESTSSIFSIKKVHVDGSDHYEVILESSVQFLVIFFSGDSIVSERCVLKYKE